LFIIAFRLPAIRFYCVIAGIVLLLGLIETTKGINPASLSRCGLWMLPLIFPPLGCALSLLCEKLCTRLPDAVIAAMLVLAGWATYSPAARFHDANEYMIKENDWKAFTEYLGGLDSTHLIIASRSDAFLVAYPDAENLYNYYGIPGVPQAELTAIASYHGARLLFKPYYFNYSPEVLVRIVEEANARGELTSVNTLVFTGTLWSNNAIAPFILCPLLPKTIISFPLLPASQTLDKETLAHTPALALLVTKRDFFDELVSPSGKAHECLYTP
jgi:hypothetical protein